MGDKNWNYLSDRLINNLIIEWSSLFNVYGMDPTTTTHPISINKACILRINKFILFFILICFNKFKYFWKEPIIYILYILTFFNII